MLSNKNSSIFNIWTVIFHFQLGVELGRNENPSGIFDSSLMFMSIWWNMFYKKPWNIILKATNTEEAGAAENKI